MKTLKIDKKNRPQLSSTLNYLINGISKDANKPALANIAVETVDGIKYAASINGHIALWVDITDADCHTPIEDGIYSIESTKSSYFLTLEEEVAFPDWKQFCLYKNEISEKIPTSLCTGIALDKSGQGVISSLYGILSAATYDASLTYVDNSLLDLIHKGAKGETWEVKHMPSILDPCRLESSTGKNVLVMPCRAT